MKILLYISIYPLTSLLSPQYIPSYFRKSHRVHLPWLLCRTI